VKNNFQIKMMADGLFSFQAFFCFPPTLKGAKKRIVICIFLRYRLLAQLPSGQGEFELKRRNTYDIVLDNSFASTPFRGGEN
jgi:hypothetical protein